MHDSIKFDSVYESVTDKFEELENVAVDAGYKTPAICRKLIKSGVTPIMPYKRPMTKKGFFRKYEYAYDEQYDCYICPNNQILTYRTTNREGYREYKSESEVCKKCPMRNQCTQSRSNQKTITRHIWEDYLEEAEHIRHTSKGKELYKMRSQTIERIFADAKEKHGMRYTQLKGLEKVGMEIRLIYTCMNLKKLASFKKRAGIIA